MFSNFLSLNNYEKHYQINRKKNTNALNSHTGYEQGNLNLRILVHSCSNTFNVWASAYTHAIPYFWYKAWTCCLILSPWTLSTLSTLTSCSLFFRSSARMRNTWSAYGDTTPMLPSSSLPQATGHFLRNSSTRSTISNTCDGGVKWEGGDKKAQILALFTPSLHTQTWPENNM